MIFNRIPVSGMANRVLTTDASVASPAALCTDGWQGKGADFGEPERLIDRVT
jgi:hypothetical protein